MADRLKSIGVGLVVLAVLACGLTCAWAVFHYAPHFLVGCILAAMLLTIAWAVGEEARRD